MSQALETMFDSLYNNTVPKLWTDKVITIVLALYSSTYIGLSIIETISFLGN